MRAAWGDGNPWALFAALGTGIAVASWRVIDATLGSQNSAFALNQLRQIVADPGVWSGFLTDVWSVLESALSPLVVEIGQLVVLDKAVLIAMGLAFFGVWKNRRWPASYAFLGVLVVVMALSALNTTQGVNFRFAMAVVPWIVLLGGSWSQSCAEVGATAGEPKGP